MADIDKPVGFIYQRSRSGSDSGKVSSDVVDAIERIFPKSPSKFLQNPFNDDHGMRLTGSKSLACTVSNAHITTDTTTTATAMFTGLSTSASGNKSPIMSSILAFNNMPSLPASAMTKNSVSEQNGNVPPKTLPKSRISRVDLEICPQSIVDSPRSAILEKICSDSDISSQSQSETPNVMVERKKHKKKRKKEGRKEEFNVDSSRKGLEPCSESNNDSEINLVSVNNGCNSYSIHSQLNLLTNGDIGYVSDDAINYPPSIKVQQKLPKIRRKVINVEKDGKYIRKKILPCFVVLRKVDGFTHEESFPHHKIPKIQFDISLPNRVKHLTDLCVKNGFDCPRSQHNKDNDTQYRNIFEECMIENSEDEFVNPRGRSLRKRNQNVSYVEPSEDDLLEEFSSFSRKKKSQISSSTYSPDVSDEKKDKALENEKKIVEDVRPSETECKEKSDKRKSKTKVDQQHEEICHTDKEKQSQDKVGENLTSTNKTETTHTGMKDDKGRSLVYVYPKNSLQATKGNNSTSVLNDGKPDIPKKRIGPASKTRQPLYTSAAPVTTLTLPRSLLSGNISGRSMPNATLSQSNIPSIIQQPSLSGITTTTASPQFYMVKIDGKDFLVPIMTGAPQTRPNTPATATLPSNIVSQTSSGPCRLLYQPVPGLSNAQSLLTRAPSPNVSMQPFSVTRFSSVMIPGAPISSGVRMISTSLATNNILSSVPLIGNSQLSTACIPVSGLSQISLGSTRPPQLIPSSIVATTTTQPSKSSTSSLTSLVRAPVASSINLTSISPSIITTKSTNITSGIQITSTVAPLAAPASTTVLRSNRPRGVATTVSSGTQLVAPNATASGTRCFRIIVPGCTATGMPARIATLGSQANSSPLTHMTINSSLLPQRKRSVEKEMSPEKRASKRRRLEKKYPLPPGVVIKTEPDDPPPQPTTTTIQAGSVRSLLGQNIQLITPAARGNPAGLQNIRIISPPTGSRQMRLGTNFIIRAPNVSAVNLSTASTSSLATNSSSLIVHPSTKNNSTISATRTTDSTSGNTASLSSTSTTTTITVSTSNLFTTVSSSHHSTISPSTGSAATVSDKITTLSYSASSSNCVTSVTTSPVVNLVPASASKDPASKLEYLKESVKALQKLICKQEGMGLKGPRLDKLKQVLAEKEKAVSELEDDQSVIGDDGCCIDSGQILQPEKPNIHGVSALDPVVID